VSRPLAVTSADTVTITADRLDDLLQRAFRAAGLDDGDARTVSEVLLDANLRGVDSHGLERAPIYLRRVHSGLAGGSGRVITRTDAGAMVWQHASNALGPVAALPATDLAIERAGLHGIALVSVSGSSHFGHAGFYAQRGAARGLLAIVASNAPASMAPHGAATAFLGANPIAIGAPLGRYGEFVVDLSTSVIARGRIRRSRNVGGTIPEGCAIDADGRPTTDPAAALQGSVLPMGGPKGSGLALGISLLTAFLADADFDDELDSMYTDSERPANIGHVFIMIDPGRLTDAASATARAEAMIDRLHALVPAESFDHVRAAGEERERCARERRRTGIPIAVGELAAFASACGDCGAADVAAEAAALAPVR
jgi:LDH2 family malate/lactate/ureidoglycolate dehydrogenase